MFERLSGLPSGIEGLKVIGRLSREDYQQVLEPMLDAARREGRRIRLLYEIGPEYEGFTPGAAWEDMRMGLASLRLFEGCAVVSDTGWVREATRFSAFMMPCPVRAFGLAERGEAIAWLSSLPEAAGISHRLLPDGVLVIELTSALRVQDFDAITAAADAWIEAHGELSGIVIHARKFPGWESFGSVIRHVQFVRDNHKRIPRIALAVDGTFASVAPEIAKHFVKAEIKDFGYDGLEKAIAWVGERAGGRA
jgi:hypothetical protein